MDMEKIIYPIGRGKLEDEITPANIEKWITDIEDTPRLLAESIEGLSGAQLDTPYREGGWTIRQLVHHLADSNINSYVRFKLAMTENNPTIKPWEQSDWAVLEDALKLPVDFSVKLLENLHIRWVTFLRSLSTDDMKRTFLHPEGGVVSIEENIWNYSWHSLHHIAQISSTRARKGWV